MRVLLLVLGREPVSRPPSAAPVLWGRTALWCPRWCGRGGLTAGCGVRTGVLVPALVPGRGCEHGNEGAGTANRPEATRNVG